jgi:hypothetical protein
MKHYLDLKDLCVALRISPSKYYAMRNPKSNIYDPELSRVVNPFNDNRLRFCSEDVEAYVVKRLKYVA